MKVASSFVSILAIAAPAFSGFGDSRYFTPQHTLAGIGVGRAEASELVLAARTQRMVESQTFGILRDPRSLAGAERITSPRLWRIFQNASAQTGLPAETIAAVAYLESWGEARAESPAGPKGIMQFSEATARSAGLRIIRATRYRITTERVMVKRKGRKPVSRVVRHKTPYTVLVADDRFTPERAVPAAARYLKRLEEKFGGRDWAIFAYHCGEGCVGSFQSMRDQYADSKHRYATYPEVFFDASPVRHRDIYDAIYEHMDRDFSPTYYFRIIRAQQLLELYRKDPEAFKTLYSQYRNQENPAERASHRLMVWLRSADFAYQNCDDLRQQSGKKLVKVFDKPEYYGFTLATSGAQAIAKYDLLNQQYYLQASPSATGTLLTIAYETRRLFDEMKAKREKWVPIEVTDLVYPSDYRMRAASFDVENPGDAAMHCTGQVFDLSLSKMGPAERECLKFILDEMGWDGYLGFTRESVSGDTLHMGPSPSSRDFFSQVFEDAAGKSQRTGLTVGRVLAQADTLSAVDARVPGK